MMKSMLTSSRLISKIALSIIGAVLITTGLTDFAQAAEGDVWITPVNSDVETNQNFDVEVHIDTGAKDLGAFNMFFDFDATKMTIDLTQGEDPTSDSGKGFHKGSDATGYIMMSNSDDVSNGHFRFAGISGGGYANGSNEHIITIHVQSTAGFTAGTDDLTLRVNELADELGHAITMGTITPATATFQAGDTAAPVRSNWFPNNDILSPGTTQVNLTLDTNENATCKYDTVANTAYATMANTFSTSGTTSHATLISGLSDGNAYTYYIRCQDAGSHQNDNDLAVTFRINAAPTDVVLSSSDIDENEAINTVVGALSTTDADGSDTHTYSLACTVAGADDASFNINNSELRASESFDYEAKNAYNICVKTDDGHSGTFDKNLTVAINDINEGSADTTPPVRSSGAPAGTQVVNTTTVDLTLTTDETSTCKYTTTANTDYASMGNTFVTTDNTNHSTPISGLNNGATYTYYVRCQDTASNANTDDFTISFSIDTPANNAPTDITLSSNAIDENQAVNTVVGILSTTDADAGDTNTYSLSCTTPGGDDASFNINGSELRSGSSFDYETKNSYAICIKTDDGQGGTFDKNFTVSINDVNEGGADTTPPTVTEVAINIFTNDNTPDYTFYSSEAGTITYSGDCSSATTTATTGNNIVTFNTLADGVHSNCTIIVTDAASNASAPLAVSSFTVDTTAPVRSSGAPVSIQSAGTTQVTISLATDETSNCRYSTTPGIAYTAMTPASFSSTGGTSHSTVVTGLSNGNGYDYYVRCANLSGTANNDDFVISFSVATLGSGSTCTSFTYSSWGTCQSSNTQTRTIVSSSPASCTGGAPVTTQSCTYTGGSVNADTNFNNFTPKVKLKGLKKKYKLERKKKIYLKKKKLSFSGKTIELIGGKVQLFIDGKLEDEAIIGVDGKWRLGDKVKKSGAHKLKFKYFDSMGNFVGESSSYKFKVDTKKPKFIDLPKYLTKRAGDKVSFEATDTKSKKLKVKKGNKIKYYKYYFLGKKHKTKDPYFIIPAGTPKGLHTLKVRAYDKAGNKAKKTVVINVR